MLSSAVGFPMVASPPGAEGACCKDKSPSAFKGSTRSPPQPGFKRQLAAPAPWSPAEPRSLQPRGSAPPRGLAFLLLHQQEQRKEQGEEASRGKTGPDGTAHTASSHPVFRALDPNFWESCKQLKSKPRARRTSDLPAACPSAWPHEAARLLAPWGSGDVVLHSLHSPSPTRPGRDGMRRFSASTGDRAGVTDEQR